MDHPLKPPPDDYSMWDDLKFGLGPLLLALLFIACIILAIVGLFI